tara:strand:+ start:36965 stop:37969 length:1005 start_codon:yes stop_codon:yes gene_type:complete
MSLTADMIREAIPGAGEVKWRDGQTTEKIFLEKMAKQLDAKKKLSEKQEALTSKIMHRSLKRSVTPHETQESKDERYGEGGYEAINRLFAIAQASGLKKPSITLDNEMGQLVTIKVAGSRSAYTGQVQIVSEDDLPDMMKRRYKQMAYNSANSEGDGWKKYNEAIGQKYHGRVNEKGLLLKGRHYDGDIVDDLLKALATDPSATIAAFGAKTGRCAACARPLKTKESTTHGYGPTCAKNYGLIWGKKAADAQDTESVEKIREAVSTSTFAVFGGDTRWGVYENDDLLMVFDTRPKAASWVHDVSGNFNIRAISQGDASEETDGDHIQDDDGWFD